MGEKEGAEPFVPDRLAMERETLRYLGYRGQAADASVAALVASCHDELEREAGERFLMREYPLTVTADGLIDGSCFRAKSRNLARNLRDCDRILVMAATLGAGVDRLLARYGKLNVTKAVVLQAASAARIEAYCNALCGRWRDEYEARGLYLRPRFSPGYGDFPLACQTELLGALEAGKRIGITLTDSLLMMPSKSVSAVIGVSRKKERCVTEGCEVCQKTDCMYRRES